MNKDDDFQSFIKGGGGLFRGMYFASARRLCMYFTPPGEIINFVVFLISCYTLLSCLAWSTQMTVDLDGIIDFLQALT